MYERIYTVSNRLVLIVAVPTSVWTTRNRLLLHLEDCTFLSNPARSKLCGS